jgi:hypothetical protein
MDMKRRDSQLLEWFPLAFACLFFAGVLVAATYTAPPPAGAHRDWATNRWAEPVEGLEIVDLVTPDVNDVTLATETDLAGYLQRVVYSHDGDDTAYGIAITDGLGAEVWARTDCNALADPCSYVAAYGGVPFADGLRVAVTDANDGDGNNVTVRLYLRHAWRR